MVIELLENSEQLKDLKGKIVELIKLINSDLPFRFQYAAKLVKDSQDSQDSQDLKQILDIWLQYFREILLKKINNQEIKHIPEYSLNSLKKIISSIQDIDFLISNTNVNPRLALEILMLGLSA